MKISHGTYMTGDIYEANGYGYATKMMLQSIQELGHEVKRNDETADAEIWFDQPWHWEFADGPYKIGYHPWESTALQDGWVEKMNTADEVWTPSPLIAKLYKEHMGVEPPVFVYEHGVDDIWSPAKRTVDDKFRFLHIGAESARKGQREAMSAFRAAFPKNPDVELNLKMISNGWNISGIWRINFYNQKMPISQLVNMMHENHVYVYPSWGEGFGLTPLQAMATGMPTITCPSWAPYADLLNPDLSIDSTWVPSPWPEIHPGQMLKPNEDELVDRMRYAYNNYDEVHADAQHRATRVRARYDWKELTRKTLKNLSHRLENSPKSLAL